MNANANASAVGRLSSSACTQSEARESSPYLSASALMTSQLIPPTLIHRTRTHGSLTPLAPPSPASAPARNLKNSTFVILAALVRTVE